MFNPTELSISKASTWESKGGQGRSVPELSYTGGGSGSMSLTLIFDTTDTGGPVTLHTNKLAKLMDVDTTLTSYDASTETGRPPWVQFHWGDLHTFKAIVDNMTLTFTYFGADGTPLRAKAVVSLKQFVDEGSFAPQNPTSGTPKPERTHQVQAGETLDRIAASYYGDPTRWRRIAEANGVHDPLSIAPGTVITIPKAGD
jgi:LysM repeat protein